MRSLTSKFLTMHGNGEEMLEMGMYQTMKKYIELSGPIFLILTNYIFTN